MANWHPHRLARTTLRRQSRSVLRYPTRMLGGARRPAPPDEIAIVCRAMSQLIKLHERMAKLDPEHFDYATIDRRARELERQREWRASVQAALQKVYGKTESS